MAATTDPFLVWLDNAGIYPARLNDEQLALLRFAFQFRQQQGDDYYSNRLLSHLLLHCNCGLKIAAIARLTDFSRQTASQQRGLSSKEAIQQGHHRMDGRPYGKLLPRYAGPIAGYLFANPKATRADLIDFIDRTFGVRVSRIALYHFLKKFGLDQPPGSTDTPAATAAEPLRDGVPELPRGIPELPAGRPIPASTPPFSPRARNSPGPSSSSPRP
jgi:hypothetical protein